jgi:hypothetical protein
VNRTYRLFYRNHLSMLTKVHAELLEQDEALRTAKTRCDLGWDPAADAYDAAGILSACIPLVFVSQQAKLDEAQRHEAAHFYANAAMTMLREAVVSGYRDAAKLTADPAFAPMQAHPEFQKLLAELETAGK